jgi:hypothetical protein
MSNEERNGQICALYKEGLTQVELGKRFGLSAFWIAYILKKAGITRDDRPVPPRRPKFTGIHLSEGVKEAMRQEAQRDGVSMSAFISALVVKELKERGINYELPTGESDVPLPFEESDDAPVLG